MRRWVCYSAVLAVPAAHRIGSAACDRRRSHLTRLEVEIGLAVGVGDGGADRGGKHGTLLEAAHVARFLRRHHEGVDDLAYLAAVHGVAPRSLAWAGRGRR
jgi:hypothetical protein